MTEQELAEMERTHAQCIAVNCDVSAWWRRTRSAWMFTAAVLANLALMGAWFGAPALVVSVYVVLWSLFLGSELEKLRPRP